MPRQDKEDRAHRAVHEVGAPRRREAETLAQRPHDARTHQQFRRSIGGNGDRGQNGHADDEKFGLPDGGNQRALGEVQNTPHDAAFHQYLRHRQNQDRKDDRADHVVYPGLNEARGASLRGGDAEDVGGPDGSDQHANERGGNVAVNERFNDVPPLERRDDDNPKRQKHEQA